MRPLVFIIPASGTPNGSSVYLMDVAYAATREPLETDLRD